MPTYDETKMLLLKHLKGESQRAKAAYDAAHALASSAIHSANVVNGAIKLYSSADCSGTALFSIDFPAELVLDAVGTDVVDSFAWSAETYPGSTNPNLDGQMVLVIAIKNTTSSGTETVTYHFKSLQSLIHPYTAGDNSITIKGHQVSVKVNADTNNRLTLTSTGLKVNVDDKADKDTDAVEHNIAWFDANGNAVDSGHAIATDAEVTAMLTEVWGA